MVTIEEVLVHPLFLLLIGAGVSSLLIPWFTKKWQDHTKKLEIKVDIASKMTEAITHQMANAYNSTNRKKKNYTDAERDADYEELRNWYVDINIISSKLESYFSRTNYPSRTIKFVVPRIRDEWDHYCSVLLEYSNASAMYFYETYSEAQKKDFKNMLEHIRTYFEIVEGGVYKNQPFLQLDRLTPDNPYNEDAWYNIGKILRRKGDDITKDVLKLPIKVF